MGLYKNCYSTSEETNSVERAVIELYDEASARSTSPGFDDVMGEPHLEDADDDGVGERVRPGVTVTLKAKIKPSRYEEQTQDETGNAPESFLVLTLFEADLISAGLLVDGVLELRPNDRLLRLEDSAGTVRVDFTSGGRLGLHCFQVIPGETGTGKYLAHFETRRQAAS